MNEPRVWKWMVPAFAMVGLVPVALLINDMAQENGWAWFAWCNFPVVGWMFFLGIQAWAAFKHRFIDAKFDGVPIGRGSPDQLLPGFVVTPLVGAVFALVPRWLLLARVGTPVDHRPRYVDCQWEALGDGPGLLGAGWRGCAGGADVCGQTVHIVHQKWPGRFSPAQRKSLLRTGDEHQRHGRCQHQEHQHHAQLDGMGQPTPDAEPRRHPLVSNRRGLHEVTGRSASE